MKLSNGRLITLRVGNGAFRLLGRKHCVPVLTFLADSDDGRNLNEIDYGVVKSHASATIIMAALLKEGWVSRDAMKRYHLTDEGRAALELATSKEARVLLSPEERKGVV